MPGNRSISALALSLIVTVHAGDRLLFLDPAALRGAQGVTLTVNPPHESKPILHVDRPLEARMISFYTTVIEEEGKLRLWYICRDDANQPNVAYAESRDGVTWTKPNLGLVAYRGSNDNNLVGLTSLDGAVFRDPNGTPDARYVYVTHVANQGVFRFTSPDGLRWRRDEQAFLPFRADTQNVVTWNESSRRYAVYLSAWDVREI